MIILGFFFCFKQKTAYEITEGDWSSDVCSSDLCTETRSWTLPIAADYGIGSGEGNPSNDGRFVMINGKRRIYVVDMDPKPPFAPYPNQRIGPALDISSCGVSSCTLDWASVSASGKYGVVSYSGDNERVFDIDP